MSNPFRTLGRITATKLGSTMTNIMKNIGNQSLCSSQNTGANKPLRVLGASVLVLGAALACWVLVYGYFYLIALVATGGSMCIPLWLPWHRSVEDARSVVETL